MSQLAETSKDQQISQHPQKCGYFVPSKLATSNKLAPYSKLKKSVSPNNSPMHKEEKQPSLASPTVYQISKKLHSIRHLRTYNELKDDSLFLHHSGTNNTN